MNHVECLIPIKRRYLDRDDVWNFKEAPPELPGESPAANRRLQIETDQRNLARNGSAVFQ